MKKILHICNDDKFIALGKKIFDSVEGAENEFWIRPKQASFEYVDFPAENIYGEDLNQEKYIQQIYQADLLCIHFLHPDLYPLLNSGKIKIPVLWIGWGGDYYWLIDSCKNFDIFLPETAKLLKLPLQNSVIQVVIKKLKKLFRHNKFKTVNKITHFSPTFQEEYDLIKSTYTGFKPEYVEWNYGYITPELIQKYSSYYCTDDKILIGNSATPTNNHADIFLQLESVLKGKKIILPLNYGDKNYKLKVKTAAIQRFGSNVQILDSFMPVDDYDRILLQCRNVIVGSMRQQAVGTIITSMYMGANIFIFKDSINYKYFKGHGFHIFTVEELASKPELLDHKLSEDQINANREKINYLWSIDKNRKTIENLLSNIEKS